MINSGKAAVIVAAVLSSAQAASAVAQTAPTVTTATPAPADPARLAAARPVIDQVWPMGTYARIMQGAMAQMTQGVLGGLYDMRPEDVVPSDKNAKDAGGKTLGEIMREADPNFQQRTDITMRVMFDEMGKLMTEVEPEVRDSLAKAYARRFSIAQLAELRAFFATDTGRVYATDAMLLMMGPDMMQAMQSFAPRMIKAMPAIMEKVKGATKDLPPPKAKSKP